MVASAWLACSIAGAADPEDPEAPQPQQSEGTGVSFVDTRPLSVKLSDLKAKGLTVGLHNDLPVEQYLSLRVVGLERNGDVDVQELFPPQGVTSDKPVAGNDFAELTLELAEGAGAPAGDPVEALLVASGKAGRVARLPITIELEKAPPTVDSSAKADVLRPDRPLDVTLVAVNFLPSPLSSGGSLLLFVVIVVAFLIAILFGQLKPKLGWVKYVGCWILLMVAAAIAVLMLADGTVWDQPTEQQISGRPLPVSSAVETGNVGTASSEGGQLAQLVVESHAKGEGEERQLIPLGLDAAGTYSGTYDLTPTTEEGSAKATINVRDFWPYALVMIALGLLIAYLLHRWLDRDRPAAKLEVAREELEIEYEREAEAYEAGDKSRAPSLASNFQRLKATIEQKLDQGDAKAAGEAVEKMRSYLDHYERLLRGMANTRNACVELETLHRAENLGVDLEAVESYQGAISLLEELRAVGKEKEEVLTAKRTELDAAEKLLRDVIVQYKLILRQLTVAKQLLAKGAGHTDELQALEGKLKELGRRTLQASKDDLKKIDEEDDEIRDKLLKIKEEIGERGPIKLSGERRLISTAVDVSGLDERDRQFLATFAGWEMGPEEPEVRLEWRRRDGEFGQGKVYREDRVQFRVTILPRGVVDFDTLRLNFGDGESAAFTLEGDEEQTFCAGHEYEKGGEKLSVTCGPPDRPPLASGTIEVDSESKTEKTKRELTDRDRVAAVAAFSLAVASGLATLYFDDPAWGEAQDYLAALVWGGITGEGVKLAAGIAKRVFPSA